MRLLLSRSIITGLLVALSISSSRCRLPGLWEPDQDSMIDPPAPPRLLQPMPDTVIWYLKYPVVPFDWTLVEDVEYYEISTDTAGSFETATSSTTRSRPVTLSGFVGLGVHDVQTYYSRIKAVNRKWKQGATRWSETRPFVLHHQHEPQ